jgi:hypothetical protein
MLDVSRLSQPTLRLVQDAGYRARLTVDLLQLDPSSPEATSARDTIDAAILEILVAAGLPRGPINGPIVERFGRGWFGRKTEDCSLLIDIGAFDLLPEDRRPDSLIRTWLHESIHARQPYAPGFQAEWRDARGFEEGVAEGLTRQIVVDELKLRPVLSGYHSYVVAYQALARALEIDVEHLWRQFWTIPAGGIGQAFTVVLSQVLTTHRRVSLGALTGRRASALAALQFANRRGSDHPDLDALTAAWRQVLR